MIFSHNHPRHGRLGNQVMRLMALIGFAKRYNTTYMIPQWNYAKYFDSDIPQGNPKKIDFSLKEPHFHYSPEYWDQYAYSDNVVDITGWLQTYRYWEWDKEGVFNTLKFKNEYSEGLKNKYSKAFSKPTIAISIRRGDFVGHAGYFQIPIKYYLGALFTHFPDWKDRNLLLFSDDINYCKAHFGCLGNAYFIEGLDIDQLCLMTLCDDFIVSNSTFSFCGAYLANRGKVIRPLKNLDGPLAKKHNEKDFWIPSWVVFNHEQYKIDLKDATFTVPVSFDHPDRKQNLDLSLCLLQRDFDTNVIVMEQGGDRFQYVKEWARYERFEGVEFHRTKMLNQMAAMAETDIVVNWDADTFLYPMQILQAVEKIRDGADMVYPFDGRSARVPRVSNFGKLERSLDVGIFGGLEFKGMDKYDSVGHCVFFDRQAFMDGGMENENMISFGPEDVERFERFKRLGFKVEKIKGPVYHLDHWIGVNSGNRNPHFKSNWAELEKIRAMSDEGLREYVNGWEWAHPYTEAYYQTIIDRAIDSRDEVFEALSKLSEKTVTKTKSTTFVRYKYFNPEFKSVIDVGCGKGEWLSDIENFGVERYIGVDYKAKNLLIPQENYIDFDLTSGKEFPVKERFDLAMSLECAEHLPERCAPYLVDTLCSLSDYVLFSAAIPGQTGVNHINEQWQTWWERLFNQIGYYASEQPLRDLLHDNENVEIWYRQNIVLYSKHFKGKVTDFVHPQMFINLINHYKNKVA
jgi:SAM-dependent methyltransferase